MSYRLSRRRLLGVSAASVALAGLPMLALAARSAITLASLRPQLAALPQQTLRPAPGGMPPAVALAHCAQSIEYALTGYPSLKPALFRQTLGWSAARAFLWRDKVSHDLAEPIPGAPPIPAQLDILVALARLDAAIVAFDTAVKAGRPLAPHFAYGELPAPDYDRLQALHLHAHLQALRVA